VDVDIVLNVLKVLIRSRLSAKVMHVFKFLWTEWLQLVLFLCQCLHMIRVLGKLFAKFITRQYFSLTYLYACIESLTFVSR